MPWSVAFMVVMIVMVVTIGRVSKEKYRAMGRLDAMPGEPQAAPGVSADEVRRLKERIQVLERVITDGRSSMDLDGEIERLRDR